MADGPQSGVGTGGNSGEATVAKAPAESLATHRMVQGREETFVIPRAARGVPIAEYFGNAELPRDLRNAQVFSTPRGPVLAPADPVPWNLQHDEKARVYAVAIKAQIVEKGYYRKSLDVYADRLSQQTGRPREETRAAIVRHFQAENGRDPFTYLQDQRAEQGLPVQSRDGPSQKAGQTHSAKAE